ncbi:hypothetical protein JIN85_12080 [Luteolibacter pohnpeiensis]|uniref:Lipoprotein n=1 Tax=Luteolibacter pohnpeiensis TaxID=454153 RepID=A0A934VWD2_9BACT|nr:hypothetical protein [Luteolibacter pohnpeiensis]MBK1883160.1 hypothetical protein [Luteolibacter pohnpeiensis]
MRCSFLILAICAPILAGLTSCAKDTEPKPVGPTTDSTNIPWNTAVPGQGGAGMFGLMPQNQYRR